MFLCGSPARKKHQFACKPFGINVLAFINNCAVQDKSQMRFIVIMPQIAVAEFKMRRNVNAADGLRKRLRFALMSSAIQSKKRLV